MPQAGDTVIVSGRRAATYVIDSITPSGWIKVHAGQHWYRNFKKNEEGVYTEITNLENVGEPPATLTLA